MTQGTQTRTLSTPREVGWGWRWEAEGGDIHVPTTDSC